jgi:hypothetical protein
MCLFHQPMIAKIAPGGAAGHTHCCGSAGLPSDMRTRAQ